MAKMEYAENIDPTDASTFRTRAGSLFSLGIAVYVCSQMVFTTGDTVRYSNILNVLIVVFFLAEMILSGHAQVRLNGMTVCYLLFSLFCWFSISWAVNEINSYEDSITITKIAVNNIILYNILIRYRIPEAILYGILLGSLVNFLIAFGLIDLPYLGDSYVTAGSRFSGSLLNPNSVGYFMVFSIFASLVLLRKTAHRASLAYLIANILLALYLIAMSASRSGLLYGLALLLWWAVFSLRQRGIVPVFAAGLLLVLACMATIRYLPNRMGIQMSEQMEYIESRVGRAFEEDNRALSRVSLLRRGYELFLDRPLQGYGVGNYKMVSGTGFLYSHSNFVEVLCGCGVVGGSLFFGMFFFLLRDVIAMRSGSLKYLYGGMTVIIVFMGGTLVYYMNKPFMYMLLFLCCAAELEARETGGRS